MDSDKHNVDVQPCLQTAPHDQERGLDQWWTGATTLLVATLFLEAVFAGAMPSGAGWARTAHSVTAAILIASTMTLGLISVVALRRTSYGLKSGLILLLLAATLFLQAALGALSAKGANLLWIHVPLGVALVGFATRAMTRARRFRGQ